MAAAVLNGVSGLQNWGNVNVATVNITSWTNGDTYTCEFAEATWAIFIPNSSNTGNTYYGLTIATNVVTLSSSGTLGGKLLVGS